MTVDRNDAEFRAQRRAVLRRQSEVTGLDYLVAEPTETAGKWRLRLHFLSFAPRQLKPADIRISSLGGQVEPAMRIESVEAKGEGSVEAVLRIDDRSRAEGLAKDSTEYTFEVSSVGLDRFFTSLSFRFDGGSVDRSDAALPSGAAEDVPDIDYLAKDYESFRRLMLETMSRAVPDWTERNPADIGVTVVEALAAAADYLSYYQDAVGTEAYLDTARQRASVRRHLRLLGYHLHEGCNSRVWVHFEVAGSEADEKQVLELPSGTRLLTRAGDVPAEIVAGSYDHQQAVGQGSLVFETLHDARLFADLNLLRLHTWGTETFSLARGATSAALVGHVAGLQAGDVLIFEEVRDAKTGDRDRADPSRRHAVRLSRAPRSSVDSLTKQSITEITFFEQDALPFPLTVRMSTPNGAIEDVTVVRGNIMLADHGATVQGPAFEVAGSGPQTIEVAIADLTRAEPFDADFLDDRSAASLVDQDLVRALPVLELRERAAGQDSGSSSGPRWLPKNDLLESSPFAREFVVESSPGGSAALRFGDGVHGSRPTPGLSLQPLFRLGGGLRGRIGPGALAHVLVDAEDEPQLPAKPRPVFVSVRNPMPSRGGVAPESLEQARLIAPRAFRERESCITVADAVKKAEAHSEVLRAAGDLRWSGSWDTFWLYVQRSGGDPLTPEFEQRLRAYLEPRLIAGRDLEIRPPQTLPVEIRLRGRIDQGFVREQVEEKLLARFSTGQLEDGSLGYFYPDNLGFGQALDLGEVLDEAMQIPGVLLMEAELFRPYEVTPERERVRDRIEPGPYQVLEMRNRPDAPQRGTLVIEMEQRE